MLEQEVRTYEAHQAELLGEYREKFVLIKGEKIVDVFTSMEDALKRGYEEFGNQSFLVKQVLEFEYPQEFTSFVVGD